MNFPTIQLNEAIALKANTGGGMFFDGNTEQLVKINRAEFTVSPNTGSTGIEFDVFNAEGQKGYFTLWFMRQDGSFIDFSYGKLQSIMAVTGVTSLTPTQATINKYDFGSSKEVPTPMTVANELMGKYFTGLFINEFEVYQGEKKIKTQLFAAFNRNRQTLQEQKDQSQAHSIEAQKERMLDYSAKSEAKVDDSLRVSGGGQQGYNNQRASQPQGGYNNQPNSQGAPQNNSVTYQRGAPAQQNYQNNASANSLATNGGGPVDDDIPFNKHFDGQF